MAPSQYRLASELVELIHSVGLGFHPGYRAAHSPGRYYAAIFKATPEAKKLSRAVHLQGQPVPATVRHSHSVSDNPWGPATSPSMAVKFYLPDGTVTDLIAIPLPLFPARTPEEFVEVLKVFKPDPTKGKPDDKKIMQFLATRPWIANVVKIGKSLPAPVSFAQTAFHAIHAFRFVNAANEVKYARYHWEPEADVASQTLEELQKLSPSYLFEELEARLRKAPPVVQNLVLQLAGDGDPTDDPTAPWPNDRPRIRIGRLEIIRTTTVEEIGDPVMLHDPTRLTDGIEASDDAILAVRRGVYEVSVAQRTGGWKGRLAALERAGSPFAT